MVSGPLAVRPVDQGEWGLMLNQAKVLVSTGFLPTAIRTPEQAVAIMLKARELGVPSMYGLSNIAIIQGKPTCNAELMLALIYRDHGDNAIVVERSDEHECALLYRRRAWDKPRGYTFTLEDAKRAGLMSNQTWQKYPAAMLRARCISAVARMAFPDSIGGMYTPEELGAHVTVGESGEAEMVALPVERPIPAAISAPPSADTDAGMAELVEQARALYRECKTRGLSPTKPASTTDVDVLGAWLDEWQTKLDDWNRDAVPFNEDDDDTAALAGVPL